MVGIRIECPECNKVGSTEVAENLVNKSNRGLTAVKIPEYVVCEHSFIAYVDKNMEVRDCFMVDFHVEIPEIDFNVEDDDFDIINELNLDLIKINIPPIFLSYLLRSIIHKKPILMISNLEVVNDHFERFANYCFRDFFSIDLSISTVENYKNKRKDYNNHVILKQNYIIRDKNKILKNKNYNIENKIVEKFYSEHDNRTSLIIFKNEIRKSLELAKTIVDFVNKFDKKDTLTSKQIIDKIKKNHEVKIQRQYYEYLVRIVENYYKKKVPVKDMSDLLSNL